MMELLWLFLSIVLFAVSVNSAKLQEDGTCPLVTLIPFSDLRDGPPEVVADEGVDYYGYGTWPSPQSLGKESYSLMAAAEMAKDHFNNRDTSIVPELADLGTCNVTFSSGWVFNSGYIRSLAVDDILRVTRTDTDAVCAVIGPVEPRANEGVAAITENLQVPQVAYATVDGRLSRQQDFPTFVRAIPQASFFARAVAEYVQGRQGLEREFAAIIYDQSDFGEQFEDPLEDAEDDLGYETMTESYNFRTDPDKIWESLEEARADGYHTLILIGDNPAVLDDVAYVANELGLLGPEYFWLLNGALVPRVTRPGLSFKVDSPTDKLLRGAAVFTNYDLFFYDTDNDPFVAAWKAQGSEMVHRLNLMHPMSRDNPEYYAASDTYFQDELPMEYASFMYDAVIATGIGACNQKDGQTHVESIFDSSFHGASGSFSFIEGENGRSPDGVIYGMYNVRPLSPDENNFRKYDFVLTQKYIVSESSWVDVEGTEFLYYDGTNNPPMPLQTVFDEHFLSTSVQIVGFVLMGFGLITAIGTALWVFIMRNERTVKAAQPEFLYLLCFGATLQIICILFISFDEGKGWSEDQLSSACSSLPWFFSIGYLCMYCALFSKLWRLSQLMSLRRRAVQTYQVLLPFCLVMLACVIVLIVWQVHDSLVWVREEVSHDPYETYGACRSEKTDAVPFLVLLALLIACVVTGTAFFAWKLKNIQEDLSESRWIFFGIVTHIQIWAIGIPLYVILTGVSRDANHLISCALVFILSFSLVALVIWPKIYTWAVEKYFGGPSRTSIVNVSGQNKTRVSGVMSSTLGSSMNTGGRGSSRLQDFEMENRNLRARMAEMERETSRRLQELESELNSVRKQSMVGQTEGSSSTESTDPDSKVDKPTSSDDSGSESNQLLDSNPQPQDEKVPPGQALPLVATGENLVSI